MSRLHLETHAQSRIGWLRAAVLGANDGIVSTASLIVGVAIASMSKEQILLAGVASLVAGAMSMAAGEYVSVSSQSDTEKADLAREAKELAEQPEIELLELAAIYEKRGLESSLARQVAEQLSAKNALAAHARDELLLSDMTAARPVQAALTSAATFAVGAALPLIAALAAPLRNVTQTVALSSLAFLAALGALGARAGGAPAAVAISRVTLWGALAISVTAAVGSIFGATPG